LSDSLLDAIRNVRDRVEEKHLWRIAYSRPTAGLAYMESTLLDEKKSGQIRYAALEALRWYDTPEAIETLEHVRETLIWPEDQVMRMQVEGAIIQVRQRMEASRRRVAVRDDAPVERDPRDDRFRLYFERELRRILEEDERERRALAPPPE
jgi:hypothetical protein